MALKGIDAVTYGVTSMDKAEKFYRDFGLKRTKKTKNEIVFETQNKSQIILKPRGSKDLPPAFEKGSSARLVTFAASAKADLVRIRKELEKDREVHDLPGDKAGGFWTIDPSGVPIAFRKARKVDVKADKTRFNAPQDVQRVNERAPYYDKGARPLTIGHIVFGVPSVAEAKKFYVDRLGFQVSDIYRGRGIFLRSAVEHSHHNMFFLESEDGGTSLNHVAFGVRDIHELFGGGQYMSEKGWETGIGPGRHRISSCYFWYMKCPAGALSEYFWDEDMPTKNWKPKVWDPDPKVFAEWVLPEGFPARKKLPPTREERDARKAKGKKPRPRKVAYAKP
jgi:catechol 2,3-dioxygenase-like lactoylglutathione lyase family enzyme